MKKQYALVLLFITIILFSISGCSSKHKTFKIVSGSENESLEPLLEAFEKAHDVDIVMDYQGSLDIMNLLGTEAVFEYDAVWPANSIWLSMGDQNKVIRDSQSIMTSPVVFGIKKSLAESLGWVGKEVKTVDILEAIQKDKLQFMMTSATQSNSGACAYLGFLSAFLGNPDTIGLEDLENVGLRSNMTELLSGVNRSSGSSGWLKDLFLKGGYDAMVNYEALIIETNQILEARGEEPLYVIYPVDGLAVADSPLAYVDQGDSEQKEVFDALQNYLLSKEVQSQISALGRRTGIAGLSSDLNPSVFKSEWGIDPMKTISGITMPSAPVIKEALSLYQSELRKPSFTVYCLDYSGSMSGEGEEALKEAMNVLLTQNLASKYMLQASDRDITVVMPFNDGVIDTWKVEGNSQSELDLLIEQINHLATGGGTDIYLPAIQGIELLKTDKLDDYSKAVVLLTDGESNEGLDIEDFKINFENQGVDIPVYAIMFGEASEKQLDEITELTRGRVFDGKKSLIEAFKKAKGYN